MIYSELPNMRCRITQTKIDNGVIIESEGFPASFYNPFDFYNKDSCNSLYLQFISINESEPLEIKKFIDSYGFLGLNGPIFGVPEFENLRDISNEIITMRRVIISHNAMHDKDIGLLKTCAYEFDKAQFEKRKKAYPDTFDKHIPFIDDKLSDSFVYLQWVNKVFITGIINAHLSSTRPYIMHESIEEYTKNPSMYFRGSWNTPTLLGAMYVMLYMDLVQGKVMRKCRNETCPDYFYIYGADDRKIYCDNRCARLQAQREYRKRIKKESEKNGRKSSETNQ